MDSPHQYARAGGLRPDFAATQRPFVRVSFGIEHRVTEAAARLRQACAETFAM